MKKLIDFINSEDFAIIVIIASITTFFTINAVALIC